MYVSVSLLHAIITPHLIIFVRSHGGSVGDTDSYDSGDKCSIPNFHKGVLFCSQYPFALKIYLLKSLGGPDFL